jgi:phosphohistidine phosphatase
MQLYLIRHAHALDAPDDFSRPLSSRGRAQVESLARHCRAHDLLHPAEVWHSPLLRARQTAQGLAAALGWKVLFQETDLLEPERDPQTVARRLKAVTHPLALVAHEPLLSALGTFLVRGSPWPLTFTMGTCDVLALEPPAGGSGPWVEQWHLGPDRLGSDA